MHPGGTHLPLVFTILPTALLPSATHVATEHTEYKEEVH